MGWSCNFCHLIHKNPYTQTATGGAAYVLSIIMGQTEYPHWHMGTNPSVCWTDIKNMYRVDNAKSRFMQALHAPSRQWPRVDRSDVFRGVMAAGPRKTKYNKLIAIVDCKLATPADICVLPPSGCRGSCCCLHHWCSTSQVGRLAHWCMHLPNIRGG